MLTKLLPFTILLLSFQGCSTVPATLNDRLSYESEKKIQDVVSCNLEFRLALDNPSKELTITQASEGFTLGGIDHQFEIGKVLNGYIEQSQGSRDVPKHPLSLAVSKFKYTFGSNFNEAAIDMVSYEATFNDNGKIGPIKLQEQIDSDFSQLFGNSDKYAAMNQALQSSTVKLFKEANKRLCGGSSSGGG